MAAPLRAVIGCGGRQLGDFVVVRASAAAERVVSSTERVTLWIMSIGLAAVFTALHIQHSLVSGALALPPTYDDVGYFLDAARRLETLHRDGLWAALSEYGRRPPHSPLSSLLALLGFSVFGVKPWAACAAMAIPLALIARALFAISNGLPLWASSVLCTALLGSPIVGILIIEFRPDALCALATASGALLIVLGRWSRGDGRTCIGAGVLLGVALLTKPAIFLLTFAVFGAAMLIAGLPRIRSGWREILRAAAISSGVAALLAAPHYAVAFGNILQYFVSNFFGSASEVWNLKISITEHFLYYVVGAGGKFALGAWLYVALAAGVSISIVSAFRGDRETLSKVARVAALIACCYLFVSLPAFKSPFIGIAFCAFIMASLAIVAAFSARLLARTGRNVAASVLVLSLLLFSIAEFASPWARHGRPPLDRAYAQSKNRMVSEIVDALRDHSLAGATIVNATIAQHLNAETIAFAMMQRGLTPVRDIGRYLDSTPDHYRASLPRVDAAIAFAPDAEVVGWLPSAGLRKEFLEDLKVDPAWALVRTIEDREGVGPVYLFVRRK